LTEPDPVWAAEPDIKFVQLIANKHIRMCGFGSKNFSVEFFKKGAFNKLYIISAIETRTGNRIERILRFSMPIHPWFTIQSEVATMEFVRLQNTIPVPRVYMFDSSGENELGLEWMIMEKIDVTRLVQSLKMN
jgi:aminoglycoside phosphotransferase (APT) family kinase protein